MLTAKGYDVGFKLENGREVFAPKSYAMLHDPSGRDWPKCSVLVVSIRKGNEEIDNREAEKYFGYVPHGGRTHLPPENLDRWSLVGDVKEIDYWRPGEFKGGWYHPFQGGGWLFPKPFPVLYRNGRALRIELGSGCTLNWRGFVWP